MEGEVRMTIYIPDDLAEQVRDKLGDTNISAVCQAALRAELRRVETRGHIKGESYPWIEVYDPAKRHDVTFQGHEIGYRDLAAGAEETAWLTPKGAIAVYLSGGEARLDIYDSFEEFAVDNPGPLLGQVAEALGEKWTEELDI
jgi:hypothetical protein